MDDFHATLSAVLSVELDYSPLSTLMNTHIHFYHPLSLLLTRVYSTTLYNNISIVLYNYPNVWIKANYKDQSTLGFDMCTSA